MTHQLKGFITCDTYINNAVDTISPLYEISDIGLTYSTKKQQYYSTQDSKYSLYVFHEENSDGLNQDEINAIIRVVKGFVIYATDNSRLVTKQQLIINYSNYFNALNPNFQLSNLTIASFVHHEASVGADYLHFNMLGIECGIWINDTSFRAFYPHYELKIVLPFTTFNSIVRNGSEMLNAIAGFNLVDFNKRIEQEKGLYPTTHVRMLNIPYRLPNSSVRRDCYFGFVQYGNQGNFDYVLKLALYEYLLSLGLTSDYIEMIFPTILEINEFFITPRWDRYAIPSRVGLNGIMSQITKAFTQEFDLDKYIKVFPDTEYLRSNSYNLPYDYNNILLTVTNGYYTEEEVRDFQKVYGDFITVTSTHPDFARMESKTQRFSVLLENMIYVADSDTTSKMFAKLMDNENYRFTMVKRQGVWYLAFFFEGHQYYMIPKYEYMDKTAGIPSLV